jgi:Ser/Thr protein kinase RdoA (MazF antagonist)
VVPWLAGVPADLVGPRPDQATTLGRFLHALHIPALEERMGRLSAHPRNILVDRGRLSAVIDWGDVTLRRARGWAVFFGVVLIDTGLVDDPRFAAIGRRTLSRIEGWAEPPR